MLTSPNPWSLELLASTNTFTLTGPEVNIDLETSTYLQFSTVSRWVMTSGSAQTMELHDGGRMCKGGSRENTIAKYNNSHGPPRFPRRFDDDGPAPPPAPPSAPKLIPSMMAGVVTPKDINKMFGITASDIDKYSRMIFPITFVCFQLMYWIIYQHLSDIIVEDLVFLQKESNTKLYY
jgi:hypothetical protein